MATESSYTIAPLSPETWPAFDALVQRHNGIFGGCWCIWFHPDGPERGQGAEANRALKKAYVEQGKAHAALVMDGDEAIAWAEYGTPAELPTLHHRKEYDATKTADPDYRITCVFVDKRHRRRGVTELAITGALDLIAQAGGGRVESYPHDLTDQTKKMSSSFLYNGTRRLYERLGFTYDRPKGLKNCVMVKTVDLREAGPSAVATGRGHGTRVRLSHTRQDARRSVAWPRSANRGLREELPHGRETRHDGRGTRSDSARISMTRPCATSTTSETVHGRRLADVASAGGHSSATA